MNIADAYLKQLALRREQSPSVVTLGVTALLLAAKMNESKHPCFANMVLLIN